MISASEIKRDYLSLAVFCLQLSEIQAGQVTSIICKHCWKSSGSVQSPKGSFPTREATNSHAGDLVSFLTRRGGSDHCVSFA